jgi:hypothetical protein
MGGTVVGSPASAAHRAETRIGQTRRNLAVQDVLVTCFHGFLFARALAAGDSAAASHARIVFAILLVITVASIALTRAELLPAGKLRAALYRVGVVVPIPATYVFGLPSLFEALAPAMLDGPLHAIDQALLGGTPAVWLNRFNTVGVNEWFSLFYQSYYAVLALGLALPPLLDRDRRLQEAMLGAAIVGTVGHATYTLVPGMGPWTTIAFAEPVHGGFWWNVVWEMVASEGVPDIFPSLHTAIPTFFTLFAFRHRRQQPFRVLWPVLAVVSGHIIVATMLLRWHWAIDIVAGLALAAAALAIAVPVSRREHARCLDGPAQPVWEPLFRWQR